MLCETLMKNDSLVTACNSVGGPGLLMVVMVILQVVLLFLGKYLWNKFLVGTITFVNPLNSVIELIAIMFISKLILG